MRTITEDDQSTNGTSKLSPSICHLRRLGEELIAAGRTWIDSHRKLVTLATEFDISGAWAADGAATCAHWIAAALDVEVSTAREWVRIGHRLRNLPTIDAAFDERRISYSKVRALSRVATPENEQELCELAERVPAGRLAGTLAAWLQRTESPEDTYRRQHEQRYLSWRVEPDGMVSGSFRLPPMEAGAFIAAIDADVMRPRASVDPAEQSSDHHDDSPAEPDATADARSEPPVTPRYPSFAQQRADALIRIVSSPIDEGASDRVGVEVIVHVRGDGCTLDDDTPVSDNAVARLLPDAFVRTLIYDAERRPINASSRHRYPTDRQKRVVKARDRVCVDCGSAEHLEYDHVPDFERSKRTIVDELQLRCGTCHRKRHVRNGGRVNELSSVRA